MNEEKYKRQFANLLTQLGDPFKAAFKIFPDDSSYAIQIANEWPKDRTVIDILNDGEIALPDEKLPTRNDLKLEIWNRMRSSDDDNFVKMGKLYAEVSGFVEKPGAQVNVQNVSNKVMVIKEKESDEQWAKGVIEQQEKLISESN